jgi:voltage-gated potassium channel
MVRFIGINNFYGMKLSKHTVLEVFENPRSKYFGVINDTLALATLLSVLAIVLETVQSLHTYATLFLTIEWVTVILFSTEYLARLWATKKRGSYAFSFFGIIDLLAILPTFIGIANFTFLKSARVVRIIRFLRLVRLSKLTRVKTKDAEETLGIFWFNILLYASTLIFAMLLVGVALHVFVSTGEHYWSIPKGMYWTFAVFLGGLPAPIPAGTSGTVIFIIAKFLGMALFGLLIGVIGKIFNEWILGKK